MTRNLPLSILVLTFLLFQLACSTGEQKKDEGLAADALIGSWRLIKTLDIGHEDTTDRRDGEEKYYIKSVNPTHFTWIEYDRVNNMLLGTGGGTYTLEDNIYTENIDFYYPPGANELGQAIPFTAEINDEGIWHHTGYAKLMEFDPETAENVMVDSAIIDELWERTNVDVSDDSGGKLVGTWNIVNYRDPHDSTFNEYPDFYQIFKLLSPTHFTWVHYNRDDDEVYAIGGGTYSITGNQYSEKILFVHPARPDLIGGDAVYNWSQDNPDHWNITGEIQGKDTIQFLEENWKKFVVPNAEVAAAGK